MRIIPLPPVPSYTPSSQTSSSSSSPTSTPTGSTDLLTVPRLDAHLMGPARLPDAAGHAPQRPETPFVRRTRARLAPRPEVRDESHEERAAHAYTPPPCPYPEPHELMHQFPYISDHLLVAYAQTHEDMIIASLTYATSSTARFEYWQRGHELRNLYEQALPPPPYTP